MRMHGSRLRRTERWRLPVLRLHRDRRGLALLETALIMPIIVIIIIAIADVGLLFYGYTSASHAVAEGARCGIVGGVDSAVTQRIDDASSFADPVSITLSDRSAAEIGDAFTVTGTFQHEWLTPGIPSLNFTNYTTSFTARMETGTIARANCPNAT